MEIKYSLNAGKMIWTFIGILVGIILGISLNYSIPIEFIKYTAILIIGIIDSLLGAIKAEVSGKATKDKYSTLIFTSGLLTNILLALGITYLGEHLGLELYLAVAVVFTFRIFKNIGKIRRYVLGKWINKQRSHTT
ncbi:DUF1290 domain-containing protein [Candidatus Peregrinibacteria bacterium]|nr:DUF1290 domain-containing protein [Candidatus Peregrinibacteria bacterium]